MDVLMNNTCFVIVIFPKNNLGSYTLPDPPTLVRRTDGRHLLAATVRTGRESLVHLRMCGRFVAEESLLSIERLFCPEKTAL